MPVTAVGIANSALIKVGADRISSLTQDTKSANLINTLYEYIRDEVLRGHPWNFAMKRDTLSPTEDEPEFEYDYEYDLPSDCLRVWGVYDSYGVEITEWVVEGRKILSDESTLYIKYVYRHEDESEWDSLFAEAFAWRLAQEVAYALTQSNALTEACEKAYEKKLREARSIDGMEGVIKDIEINTWTDARR